MVANIRIGTSRDNLASLMHCHHVHVEECVKFGETQYYLTATYEKGGDGLGCALLFRCDKEGKMRVDYRNARGAVSTIMRARRAHERRKRYGRASMGTTQIVEWQQCPIGLRPWERNRPPLMNGYFWL